MTLTLTLTLTLTYGERDGHIIRIYIIRSNFAQAFLVQLSQRMAIEIDDEDGRGRVKLDYDIVDQILGKNVCLPLAGDPTCFWPYTNYKMKGALDFSRAYRLRSTISDLFAASDGRLLVQKAFLNQVEKWLRASGAPHFWTNKHIALQVYGLRACMSQMRYAKIRNTNIPVKYEQLGAIFSMIRVPQKGSKSTDLKGLEDDDGDVELLDDDDVSVVSVSESEMDFMEADRAAHESLAEHEIEEPDNLDELLDCLFATPRKPTLAELIAARPTPSGCEGPTPDKLSPPSGLLGEDELDALVASCAGVVAPTTLQQTQKYKDHKKKSKGKKRKGKRIKASKKLAPTIPSSKAVVQTRIWTKSAPKIASEAPKIASKKLTKSAPKIAVKKLTKSAAKIAAKKLTKSAPKIASEELTKSAAKIASKELTKSAAKIKSKKLTKSAEILEVVSSAMPDVPKILKPSRKYRMFIQFFG